MSAQAFLSDESGKPIPFFHGTTADFARFDPLATPVNDDGYMGAGTYFIAEKKHAENYAEMAMDNAPGTPRVIEAFLIVRKPYTLHGRRDGTAGMTREQAVAWTNEKKAAGFDAVTNGYGEWVVFSSEQIVVCRTHPVMTELDDGGLRP